MSSSDRNPFDCDAQKPCHDFIHPFVTFKKFADEQFTSLINRAFGSNPFILNPAVSYQAFKKDYEAWLEECRANDGVVGQRGQHDMSQPRWPTQHDLEWRKCPYRPPEEAHLSEQEKNDLCSFFDEDAARKAHKAPPIPSSIRSPEPEVDSMRRRETSEIGEALGILNALMSASDAYRRPQIFGDRASHAYTSQSIGARPTPDGQDDSNEMGYLQAHEADDASIHTTTRDHPHEDKQPDTELDLIRGLLDRRISSLSEHQNTESDIVNESETPTIISTLSTVHKVTLADGKVVSKTVLRNKFSDGREESSESQHVQHPPPVDPAQSAILQAEKAQRRQQLPTATDKARAKGWFWN